MAHDGTGSGWDINSPTVDDLLANGRVEIIDIRTGVGLRLSKEHVAPEVDGSGGEHLLGSARVYVVDDAEDILDLRKPDGLTAIDSNDEGRLVYVKATGTISVFDDEGGTTEVLGGTPPYVLLRHRESGSVAGGTFTAGSWQTRTLNQELHDTSSLCTLSGNAFTLQPGVWRFRISAPAMNVKKHVARLYNVTANSEVAIGTSELSEVGSNVSNRSVVEGIVTLSVASTLRVEHWCQTTAADNGFGPASPTGSGDSIFTVVELVRISL